jgi:spore germination protein KC
MTLFDAVRNAKKRLSNKLYFGNTQVVVLGQDVALTEGIDNIIGWFLRDAECRETVHVAVSQEKTAEDLLSISGVDQAISSLTIHSVINEDASITASTVPNQLYQIFSILKSQGKALTLPAFHSVINSAEPAPEANGIAVFQGDKLAGFLTPEESKYFLFAVDGVKGGILPLPEVPGVSTGVSLEISQSKTKRSYAVRDGKLVFHVDVKIKAFLGEAANMIDAEDKQIIKRLQDAAGEMVRQKMLEVMSKVQSEYSSDIFGFGEMIYKGDPRLWNKLRDSWDSWFSNLDVEIACKVDIVNTAFLQKS